MMRLLGASVSFRWGSVSEPASGLQQPDKGVAAYLTIYARFADDLLPYSYYLFLSIIVFILSVKATKPFTSISFKKISPCVARMSGWAFS